MFYESIHSAGERYLRLLDENRNFSFPLHLHTSFELLCVEDGEMTVTVSGLDFSVQAGECALILPGQPHAYRTEQHSLCRICIFSTDHLPDLHRYAADRCHVPVFPQPGEDFIGRIAERKNDIFRLKALLYEAAGAYAAGEVCPPLSEEDDSLICGIVNYIEEHYTGQLTLKMLAEHFGYNYRYLSGVINQAFRMNFAQVLTQYRISRACALLKQGGLTIAEIARCSGFATQRNFNRAFRAMTGKSPKEYLSDANSIFLHS